MLFSKSMLITKAVVGMAVCLGSTAAVASSACQAPGDVGCVLPVRDAPLVAEQVVPQAAPIQEVRRGGFGLLPILAALLGIAALGYFLFDGDGDGDPDPVSP